MFFVMRDKSRCCFVIHAIHSSRTMFRMKISVLYRLNAKLTYSFITNPAHNWGSDGVGYGNYP